MGRVSVYLNLTLTVFLRILQFSSLSKIDSQYITVLSKGLSKQLLNTVFMQSYQRAYWVDEESENRRKFVLMVRVPSPGVFCNVFCSQHSFVNITFF